DARMLADLARPDAGAADDDLRGDRARWSLDADDATVAHRDRGCGAALADLGSRLSRVPLHDRLGRRVAVALAERRAHEIDDLELRHELPRVRRRELARRDAERLLQREGCAEGRRVRLVVEQEEIAVLAEGDLVGHRLELAQRPQGDADVQLVRELRADAARRLARRAGRKRVALEQDDVFDAEPAQVEGGGGAEGAATDDYDVGRDRATC